VEIEKGRALSLLGGDRQNKGGKIADNKVEDLFGGADYSESCGYENS